MASISNLFVDQGSDFSITVSLTDASDSALNLSGNTFLAQVRKSHGSNTIKATFNTPVGNSTPVKIFSSYKFDIKLTGDFVYEQRF